MIGPKSLIRSVIRRFVHLMYGEHPLDRLRRDIRQVDRRREKQAAALRDTLSGLDSGLSEANQRLDQTASLAHVDGKVSEFLSESASGFKARDVALSKVRSELTKQTERISQMDSFLGDADSRAESLPDRLALILGELDVLLVAVEAGAEARQQLQEDATRYQSELKAATRLAESLWSEVGEHNDSREALSQQVGELQTQYSEVSSRQRWALDGVKKLAKSVRDELVDHKESRTVVSQQVADLMERIAEVSHRMDSSAEVSHRMDSSVNELTSRAADERDERDERETVLLARHQDLEQMVGELKVLVGMAGESTLDRLGSLDLQAEQFAEQLTLIKGSEIQSKIAAIDKSRQGLLDRVAKLESQLDDVVPANSDKGQLVMASLKDAVDEAGVAAGRDRRLLHDLRAWSEAISSLDLDVRLAQWDRSQASLERLEAKLEEVTEGVDESHEAGRKIAEQVRRLRARVETLESSPASSTGGQVLSELQETIKDIEAIHGRSNEHIRKVDSLGRRTRDLVRRHLENHHCAGFVPDPWLESARDRHLGQRCFLLGSGPSLASLDPAQLDGEVVMSLNGASQLEGLRSDYFMTVAHEWWQQNVQWLDSQKVGTRRFLPPYVGCCDDGIPTSRMRVASAAEATIRGLDVPQAFGLDAARLIYLGGTVVFPALQVLFYLGFAEVVLLGIDHSYAHADEEAVQKSVPSSSLEHFKPDYYTDPLRIHCDIPAMERAYRMALGAWEVDGRRLLNATPNTRLDIIPRADLATVLGQRSGRESSTTGTTRKTSTTGSAKKASSKKKSASRKKKATVRKRTRT